MYIRVRDVGGAAPMSTGARALSVAVGIAFGIALIVYYIVAYLVVTPPVVAGTGPQGQTLTLQTVAALGFKPHVDWVSYLVKNQDGKWVHSTVLRVPANSTIDVTIYQFDTAYGAEEPLLGRATGSGRRDDQYRRKEPPGARSGSRFPYLRHSRPWGECSAQGRCGRCQEPVQRRPVQPWRSTHDDQVLLQDGQAGQVPLASASCRVRPAFCSGSGGPMQSIGYMDGYLEVVK